VIQLFLGTDNPPTEIQLYIFISTLSHLFYDRRSAYHYKQVRQKILIAASELYLGMSSGQAGSGRASKKPDSKNYRAMFFCLGLGRRAGTSVISHFFLPKPSPLLLSGHKFLPKPSPTACFSPTGRAIFGPGWAGLPMPSYRVNQYAADRK
jgi:hypothetical protein